MEVLALFLGYLGLRLLGLSPFISLLIYAAGLVMFGVPQITLGVALVVAAILF
jgi:hypothetical protein